MIKNPQNLSAITFCGVSKSFGDKKIFDNFNCSFEYGHNYCIMGESGCGKTTLLNLMMGLVAPDGGEITGVPTNIAAVFQEDRLVESYTALGNIIAVTGKMVTKQEINDCLNELGLSGCENAPVCDFSGGMRRRVAVARALLADGEILLLDEPFNGLDEETKIEVIKRILSRTKGKTVITVTHDQSDASLLNAEIIKL